MVRVVWTVKELVECLRKRQLNKFDCNIGVSGSRGNGKTQVKGNKVLLSNGSWKNIENIKIGDEVVSPQKDGSFTFEKVIDIHSRFEKEIYDIKEVGRNKKILYSCSWNHELPIIKTHSNRTSKISNVNARYLSKMISQNFHHYSLQFKDPRIIPLRLKRKKERLRIRKIHPTHIAVISIKRNKGAMVYGFSINGNSKWYVTDNYMVTHNSTLFFKIFHSFCKHGFNQNSHQVYSRKDVIRLLSRSKFGFCWDDEAINSGYKREFHDKGQQKLIKVVTNYRDNFNIYGSALPFFYSLDKGLRELIFLHIHIIERGVAVMLLPLENQIHGQDPWDTDNNKKIESKENKRLEKNPNAIFRYHRLTTFAGYLYFNDMTEKQRKKYEAIKAEKRAKEYEEEQEEKELTFMQKVFNSVIEKKLSKETLQELCLYEGKKYSIVSSSINVMLKDKGFKETLSSFVEKESKEAKQLEIKEKLLDVIPEI